MGELQPPLAEFDSEKTDPSEKIARLRQTASQQALFYRDNQERLVDRHAGSFIYLQDGEVIWSGPRPDQAGAVHQLSGDRKDQAVWLKLVDPEETEGERMRVYERILAA